MRTIARGNTIQNCQKQVNHLKCAGWTPITEIKLDPSPSIDISFVCVLERPENKNANKSGSPRWEW